MCAVDYKFPALSSLNAPPPSTMDSHGNPFGMKTGVTISLRQCLMFCLWWGRNTQTLTPHICYRVYQSPPLRLGYIIVSRHLWKWLQMDLRIQSRVVVLMLIGRWYFPINSLRILRPTTQHVLISPSTRIAIPPSRRFFYAHFAFQLFAIETRHGQLS